uniref:Uncharacterized protein n=1 Tax=viral metagenome TaxID=1070528 RepID=A0A6C0BTF2_9ZZZZ
MGQNTFQFYLYNETRHKCIDDILEFNYYKIDCLTWIMYINYING